MVAPLEKSFRCILCHLFAATAFADSFVNPPNTERDQSSPLPPQEAALGIRLPDGFRATVFAAEPDVQQPIAMAFDARGRLWVAECYTYAESRVNFDLKLRDRVVIFTDTDKDGRFDTRKVFWDKGERLTSIELGFGGLWATCAPNLLFIPDKDGDDVPDGEAEIVLDGFDAGHVRHNIVNGLRWGPDGWLYGRHGIQNYSFVGKPGAPEREAGVRLGQRTKLSCCIWRIHPIRRTFEVVAEGTTNSWGHDWNELGDGFFTNTVIGHLWHLIPGAHYRRMYGEDLNPHVYQLLEQCADHFHWDTGEDWTKSRASETGRVSKKNDTLGGGHAHCGCLIYQGDMFPPEWRGKVLTLNFHGRRINVDRLEPRGSGYIGRHEPDFAFFADPWFRGIDLIQAPDGSVYIADWSDAGECHDNDGVHRTSGRIFRIAYQPDSAPKNSAPRSAVPDNVAALKESELIALQLSANEWLVRTARRVLQERAAAGAELGVARASLIELFAAEKNVTRKLRLLWALAAVNGPIGVSDDIASSREDDAIIAWQILLDPALGKKKPAILTALANRSPRVRLSLLAALQRLPAEERWPILEPLVAHKADASDPNLPLLAWYWLAPLAGKNLDALAGVAHQSAIPQVTRLIGRRVAEEIDQQPQILERLLAAAVPEQADRARQIVAGMRQGLQGRQRAKKPSNWEAFQAAIAGKGERQLEADVRDLSALFGDGKAVKEIRAVALDGSSDYLTRRAALQTLVESRDSELRPICEKTIGVRELASTAARGLATFDDPAIATLLLRRLGNVWHHDRPALISALVSRPTFAKLLLDAVGEGQVARQELTPFHARQIRAFNDEPLTQKLAVTWGKVSDSDEGKRALITKLKGALQPEVLKPANRDAGKALFQQSCATCHRLFGEGNQIGPDLTGSDRGSLDYLLENIVDPNAIVPVDARMTVVTMKDGRVLSGMLGAKTDRTLTLRAMAGETHTLERTQITSVEELPQSMMPEGLLQTLDQTQVRDLIAYLMTDAPTK